MANLDGELLEAIKTGVGSVVLVTCSDGNDYGLPMLGNPAVIIVSWELAKLRMSWKMGQAASTSFGGHGNVSGLLVVLVKERCPCRVNDSHRVPEAVHMPPGTLSVVPLLKDVLEAGTLAAVTPPLGRAAGSASADACRQAAF